MNSKSEKSNEPDFDITAIFVDGFDTTDENNPEEMKKKQEEQAKKEATSFLWQDFRNSGISRETIQKYIKEGYLSETDEYWQLFYPSLYANYRTDYYTRRLKNPVASGKYRKPVGKSTQLFRPLDFSISKFMDSKEYVILTEGDKKAIKAVQEGFNCISLSGVWNWKQKPLENTTDGETEVIDPWEDNLTADIIDDLVKADFEEKEIYLCYDNDMWRNSKVFQALYSLAAYLISEKRATVKIIELPNGEAKGLDDFLIAYGANEFQKLMDKAEKLTLQDIQNKLSGKKKLYPFPIDFFPEDIAKSIKKLHKNLDAPIEYIACTILSTLSIVMDGYYAVNVFPASNWIEYPILWMALVGNPSQKKTPCLKIGKEILDDLDLGLQYDYEERFIKYKNAMDNYKVENERYKKQLKKEINNEDEE